MQRIGNAILRLIGWRMVGEAPRQCVIIGAPHTSNWDFPLAILAFWSLGADCKWVGKHTLFRWPFGWFMRRLGGIPLNRSTTKDFVSEVVTWFEDDPDLKLVIAPEGTRSKKGFWRSGFYWIANGAGVPIVLGFVDYEKKVGGFGPAIVPTGDSEADMDRLREFYSGVHGKRPDKLSPIRLRPGGDPSGGS